MKKLKASGSADPAEWIVERIQTFGKDVGSVVPEGFEAYVRVFHPAWRGGPDGHAVTWGEIAASTGRVMHPGAQWPHIAFTGEVRQNELDHGPPGAPWRHPGLQSSLRSRAPTSAGRVGA